MAAPQIPNLLDTLRARGGGSNRSRGGPRSRGSASATGPRGPTPTSASSSPSIGTQTSPDAVIQATDTDAAGSRLSAVRGGWLDNDEFAEIFYQQGDAATVRRMPIINRGTYVRTKALDQLVAEFLSKYAGSNVKVKNSKTCQIVSLGAGTDTRWPRFWRTRQPQIRRCRWLELDFEPVLKTKQKLLQESSALQDASIGQHDWACVGGDLRDLLDATSQTHADVSAWMDKALPTLLLSEMCLTYLPPSTASTPILSTLMSLLQPETPCHVTLYEPLTPHDAFGRTMIQNLAARNIRLPGLEGLPSLESHGQRLSSVGCSSWDAETVGGWWRRRVTSEDKERLRGVEMVDEEEEWELLAAHYGIIWGWRGAETP